MGIGAAAAGRRVQEATGRSHAQSPCKSQVAQRFDEARPTGHPQSRTAGRRRDAPKQGLRGAAVPACRSRNAAISRDEGAGGGLRVCGLHRTTRIPGIDRKAYAKIRAGRACVQGLQCRLPGACQRNSYLDECEMNDPRRTDERSATKLLLTFEAACNQKPARELSKQAVISISLAPMARRNVWNFRVGAQASETSGFSFGTKQTRFRTEPMAGLQTKGGVRCGT